MVIRSVSVKQVKSIYVDKNFQTGEAMGEE